MDERNPLLPRIPENDPKTLEDGSKESKLGTYDGVFVPTTLNVLSILMFLRFGFIVGQAGILGSLLLLAVSYAINLLTTMSLSAIATNGVVKGGGTYFMVSRSLGPEFGGSIGVIFYVGQVLNAALNVAGFVDPLVSAFGVRSGTFLNVVSEAPLPKFLYEAVMLLVCTIICLVGPALFARSSKFLFWVLITATLSVPLSIFFVSPFYDLDYEEWYTGFKWSTLLENMLPNFTEGAAGSEITGRENFRDLFGIFFPATAGILAGASMSGDLKKPSKSIPAGTLWSLAVTVVLYFLVILAIGCTTPRELLHQDSDIISHINVAPFLVVMGEFATSIFSSLMGVIGAAKLLQAIAWDQVVPFLKPFRGKTPDSNPVIAILTTYVFTQLTALLPMNRIAVFITMAFLLTFVVTNFACFLLDLSSAPNFRPSFRYFNATTGMVGSVVSVVAMFVADGLSATGMLLVGVFLFFLIHVYCLPKPWGDVSQALIYHQVRKYLLKLRQDHVKYWRPQILLLVDDPRSCWNLIWFCNYLKKGGLFILGHVISVSDFRKDYPEVEKQRTAWQKLRDWTGLKAFVQLIVSPSIVWGCRNAFLGSGLGGMKPNITVLGFYDEFQSGQSHPESIDVEELPTDVCRKESHMSYQQWTNIIEDLLRMGTTVCVAKGFMKIHFPRHLPRWKWWKSTTSGDRGRIDLYPIQISAQLMDREGHMNGMSINFDTYTLILQLGTVLHSVKDWQVSHDLRVVAFVEHSEEVAVERGRIEELLATLRIPAELEVIPLDKGNYVYDVIVRGMVDTDGSVDERVGNKKWWSRLCQARAKGLAGSTLIEAIRPREKATVLPMSPTKKNVALGTPKRRRTLSQLQSMGIAHSMQSTKWKMRDFASFYNGTQSSDSESGSGSDSDPDDVSPAEDEHLEDPSFIDDPMTTQELEGEDIAADPYAQRVQRQQSPEQDELSFNDLPARAQHMILNCLMRNVSMDSTVIFSTLPAPAPGTHESERDAREYHRTLELFCEALPPIALIHSQSMTVTTAL